MEREASRSDAVRVGPAWLQRHGCEFVTDVSLRREKANAREQNEGKSNLYFNAWPRPGKGEYICHYTACQEAI